MDFLGSAVGTILTEIGRGMCRSTYSRAANTIRFKSNIIALKDAFNSLVEVQNKVNKDLKTMEIKGKSLNVQLRRWLRDVEEIVIEANSMHQGGGRFRMSKKVVVILEKVKKLEKQGIELLDVFSVEGKSEIVEKILGPSIPDQTKASEMLVKVITCLTSDGVQKVGIWGMGGVGKTTLVRELNNKLWKESTIQPFGMVIWATVSKEFELGRVQKQIAERLDIEVGFGETEEKLARRIYGKLEKVSSFLVILDDVWKPIDLDQLGIPYGQKGSKIVLTSRFLEVCQSIKTDVDFRVDCLCEEEAWELFCQNAGQVTRSDRVRPIAKKVSRECGGLPLAIITVGMAMRGKKKVKLWKHALKELKSSVPYVKSIEEKIYQPLKLSYDLLEQNMKSCLLFCALFPEDYSIEVAELVRYWIAEGFIDETQQNHGELMNQGVTLIENLKDSCLLEEGVRDDTIKMHDVVRDFSIWIMSSSQEEDIHSLVMSGIGLHEFPEHKFIPCIRRVCLMNNKLERLPDKVLSCGKLSALLLQGNRDLEELPVGFLPCFPSLRILNLSGTRIKSLCASLSELHELRSLILRDCYYLEEVPSLQGLTKIQVLNLCATRIKELPKGLETLNSLRLLDLSRTHHLESISAGIISQLSSLEILDMTLSHFHWGFQGQTQQGQATLEEIACLHRLSVLSIRVFSVPDLSLEYNSWIERLKKFQLFIGPTANSLPTRHDKRRVTISSLNVSEAFIGWLLANTTSLVMNHCWGLNEMLENLVIDSTSSFDMLKSLTVESFGGSIRPAGGCVAQLDLLPNLEELHLRRVNLENVRELVGHLGLRFQTLRHLEISRCSRLKCLLSLGNFICFLPNLQEIHVSFCDMLKELFEYSPGEVIASDDGPIVPALRVIKLRNLPRLRRLCSQEESWRCLEYVEVIKCNLLKSLPICSDDANRVKEVRGETHWWNDLTWRDGITRETIQPRFVPVDGNVLTDSL